MLNLKNSVIVYWKIATAPLSWPLLVSDSNMIWSGVSLSRSLKINFSTPPTLNNLLFYYFVKSIDYLTKTITLKHNNYLPSLFFYSKKHRLQNKKSAFLRFLYSQHTSSDGRTFVAAQLLKERQTKQSKILKMDWCQLSRCSCCHKHGAAIPFPHRAVLT